MRHLHSRPLRPFEIYLIAGIALTFLIFTLVRTKLTHYTLPAYPFLALLLANWWTETGRSARVFHRTVYATVVAVLIMTLIGFPFAARYFASDQIYRVAEPYLRRNMVLATVDYHEPSLVWLFRRRLDASNRN